MASTQITRREQIHELKSSQGGEKSSNWNSKIAFEQIDDCSGGRVGYSKCEACVCMTCTATQIIVERRLKKELVEKLIRYR